MFMSGYATLPARASGYRLPRMMRALAHRDYRLWALADLLSTVGSWMQLIAQNWMVLELTHSPAQLGVTIAVQSAPTLALGMWGGNIVDRLPRKPLLVVTQGFFAALALVLAATTAIGALNIWVIWSTALLTGLATTINTPAVGALCADMVPVEDLGNAIALGAATSSTGRMLGMASAGWVVAALEPRPRSRSTRSRSSRSSSHYFGCAPASPRRASRKMNRTARCAACDTSWDPESYLACWRCVSCFPALAAISR